MQTSIQSIVIYYQLFSLCEAGLLTVQPHEVCKKLLAFKPSKAHGPDNVPCSIVQEFAYELAEPITTIFKTSLQSGIVPVVWKEYNIIPYQNSITYGWGRLQIYLVEFLSVQSSLGFRSHMVNWRWQRQNRSKSVWMSEENFENDSFLPYVHRSASTASPPLLSWLL